MVCHAALDLDADGRELLRPDPHTGALAVGMGLDPVGGRDGDARRLERLHVGAHRLGVAELDDRVCDQLARAVVGHVPAALDRHDADVTRAQHVRRHVGVATGRVDGVVLQGEQDVADRALRPGGRQEALPAQRLLVHHAAAVHGQHRCGHP